MSYGYVNIYYFKRMKLLTTIKKIVIFQSVILNLLGFYADTLVSWSNSKKRQLKVQFLPFELPFSNDKMEFSMSLWHKLPIIIKIFLFCLLQIPCNPSKSSILKAFRFKSHGKFLQIFRNYYHLLSIQHVLKFLLHLLPRHFSEVPWQMKPSVVVCYSSSNSLIKFTTYSCAFRLYVTDWYIRPLYSRSTI